MRFKRFSAMLLALAMCMGVFSTTAFAYSDESATTTTTEKAETVETVPEKTEDKTSEELPYTVTVNEDGTVVFSFNGKEWIYDTEESEDNNMGTGKVVTSGSRLNVRTGAGMNYEIIDQLRPGESLIRMLIMWTMTMGTILSLRTMMQIALLMKMIMNLCKQDRLDAWGSFRVVFT